MLHNKIIPLLFISSLTFLLLIISCERNIDEVVVPKICDVPANMTYSRVTVNLQTDTTVPFIIIVDKSGYISADNIIFKKNGYFKNAAFTGYVCGEGTFHADIFYNDTVDNSKLKIDGTLQPYLVQGTFYYCPNINNNCTYTEIGDINSGYSAGSFYTPRCAGQFTCSIR